jgi:hypothetical protein
LLHAEKSLSLPSQRFFPLSLWISAPSLWGLLPPWTVTMIINTNTLLGMCMKKETMRPFRLNSGVSGDVCFKCQEIPYNRNMNNNIIIEALVSNVHHWHYTAVFSRPVYLTNICHL